VEILSRCNNLVGLTTALAVDLPGLKQEKYAIEGIELGSSMLKLRVRQ